MRPLACSVVVVLTMSSCASRGREADSSSADVSAADGTFVDCPLHLEQPEGPRAECATFSVPLDWDSQGEAGTSDRKIPIFVQRLRGTAPGPHKQLWMLQGGPGAPGSFFSPQFAHLSTLDPSVDFYTIDHRGVGRSTRLGCPEQESDTSASGFTIAPSEFGACIDSLAKEWGNALGAFSTTFAARDLHAILARTRGPEVKAFVYGVSYGTHWAHRYLQLYPTEVSGAILDGVAVNLKFDEKDIADNAIAKRFFDACDADEHCHGKMGAGSSWDELGRVLAAIEEPAAPCVVPGVTKRSLRSGVASLLRSFQTRSIVPAVVHRLARCNEADRSALRHLVETFDAFARPTPQGRLISAVASANIIFGEMWRGRPAAAIERDFESTFVATTTTIDLAPFREAWTERLGPYTGSEFLDGWASTDVPILLMNGDLDTQTTPDTAETAARQLASHSPSGGLHQYFFRVPRGEHGLLDESPVHTPGAEQCGTQLLTAFLADETTRPPGGCLEDVQPLTFDVPADLANLLLGTADAWGD